jgi:hypothetical protein
VVIEVLDLQTGTRKTLVEGSNPEYAASGHLVFTRGATVYAAPFDARRLALAGTVIATSEQVQVDGQSVADFAVAADGTCVFVQVPPRQSRLVCLDSTGRATHTIRRTFSGRELLVSLRRDTRWQTVPDGRAGDPAAAANPCRFRLNWRVVHALDLV